MSKGLEAASHFFSYLCSCPGLSLYVSPAVPIYNAIVFLFVLANFSMATFMDPGIFPRGKISIYSLEIPHYLWKINILDIHIWFWALGVLGFWDIFIV